MKIKYVLWVFIFLISSTAYATDNNVTYESAEHIFIGDQVILTGLGQVSDKTPLKLPLPNGLHLTYGDIVAMPDYYGEVHHSISAEKTQDLRDNRFTKIFSEFAHGDTDYFNAFWPIIQKERDEVMKAYRAHQDVTKVYKAIADQESIALALATHMRYLSLTLTCFDHFNQDAILAYQAGHAVAVQDALLGFRIKSAQDAASNLSCAQQGNFNACIADMAKKQLIKAYEENAFASHYLSDRFASGHIRNPYRDLYTKRPIAVLGALSGNLMHNEDNRLGVIVTNLSGQYWIAYGDNYYFSPQNKTNRSVLKNVMQLSADEVNIAFQTGVDSDPLSQQILNKIPIAIEAGKSVDIPGIGKVTQTAPLYQAILGTPWQRIDVNNPYGNQWTPWWSTILTLILYHVPNEKNISMTWQLILKQHHMENALAKMGF